VTAVKLHRDQYERGDRMKNATQVYVLTLNAPSRKTVRLWTGASIHSLRHCTS